MGRGGEPAALDRREVLADHIHLADVGATGEECLVDRLLVRKRQALGRQGEQRRAATRNQAQDQVVRSGASGQLEDPPGGGLTRGVGHGMRRLHDLDPLARHGMPVAGDHEALERPRPVFLDGLCHGGGGLAGAEDDGAPLGGAGRCRHDPGRERRRDGRIEHARGADPAWSTFAADMARSPGPAQSA